MMKVSNRAAGYLKLGPRDKYYASMASAAMKDARALLRRHRLAFEERTLIGDPAYDLADFVAKGRFDLVVMGSHGYGAAKSLFLGSMTQRVLARSSVPALIVR
jgi:nucleotide-binding universal stress UspA family protein